MPCCVGSKKPRNLLIAYWPELDCIASVCFDGIALCETGLMVQRGGTAAFSRYHFQSIIVRFTDLFEMFRVSPSLFARFFFSFFLFFCPLF